MKILHTTKFDDVNPYNGQINYYHFNFKIKINNFEVPFTIDSKDKVLEIENGTICIDNKKYKKYPNESFQEYIDMEKNEKFSHSILEKKYKNLESFEKFLEFIKEESIN